MKVRGNTVGTTYNPEEIKKKLDSESKLPIASGEGEGAIMIGDLTNNSWAKSRFSMSKGAACQVDPLDPSDPNSSQGALASGSVCIARGRGAHSLGRGVFTAKDGQLGCGTWTALDTKAILICGDGTDHTHRHNAFAVYSDSIVINGVTITSTQLKGLLSFLDTTFRFQINGKDYIAKVGMTWEEWCNSEYNTDGYWYDALIYSRGGTSYVAYSTETGGEADFWTIKAGHNYILRSNG